MSHKISKSDKKLRNYLYLFIILGTFILITSQLNLSLAGLGLNVLAGNTVSASSGLPSVSASASENEIISAMLPKDNEFNRPYTWKGQAVTLSAQTPGNGYDMLVDMEKSISPDDLTPGQRERYDSLVKNIYHPCCDAPIGGCGCKHAVAAKGIVKFLLSEGWSDNQIEEEVFLWLRYWWPKHYATLGIYLTSQGTDPSEVSAKEWIGEKFSTQRALRAVEKELNLR